jgi:hypothetical protein
VLRVVRCIRIFANLCGLIQDLTLPTRGIVRRFRTGKIFPGFCFLLEADWDYPY